MQLSPCKSTTCEDFFVVQMSSEGKNEGKNTLNQDFFASQGIVEIPQNGRNHRFVSALFLHCSCSIPAFSTAACLRCILAVLAPPQQSDQFLFQPRECPRILNGAIHRTPNGFPPVVSLLVSF